MAWKLTMLIAFMLPNLAQAACLSGLPGQYQKRVDADGVTWHLEDNNRRPIGTVVVSCKADPNDLNSWVPIGSSIPQRAGQICEGTKLDSPRKDLAECQVEKVTSARK